MRVTYTHQAITTERQIKILQEQLCYIAYLLNAISPNNTFVVDLKRLIKEHPSVQIQQLVSFPHNWEQEPLSLIRRFV